MTNVVTAVLPEKHARVLEVWEQLPVVTKAVIQKGGTSIVFVQRGPLASSTAG